MRLSSRTALPVAALLTAMVLSSTALAAPLSILLAQYEVPTPPVTAAASATMQVAVRVTNVGTEPWNASGASPVNLAYHWYDAAGAVVVFDGERTPLGADVGLGAQRAVTANVVAPAAPGQYTLRFALVKEGVAWFPPSAAYPVTIVSATYIAGYQVVTPPTQIPAGTSATVRVALANTSNQTWTAGGTNPVNLAYHWYDAAGKPVVYDGARSRLPSDVAPGGAAAVDATVVAPDAPGTYTLRFALVKEGVAWFVPSDPYPVTAQAAFMAAFSAPALPAFVAGGTYAIDVPVRNAGASAWTAGGANPITLGYHWLDGAGRTVVWDGERTRLAADVAPNAQVTIPARVTAPSAPGTYTLVLDMVREGVAWFERLGSTPLRAPAAVAEVRYAAGFSLPTALTGYWAERKTVQVTVVNTGNITWSATGATPFNLAYHLYDKAGKTLVWDGARTPLGTDLAPGQSRTLPLTFPVPSTSGDYTLAVEMVREGVGWFSQLGGTPAVRIPLAVTSGLSAAYGATTTPGQVTIGATVDLTVVVANTGPRTWPATGDNAVRLSYHVTGQRTGNTYIWDGARGVLPNDVPPNTQVSVPIRVSLPAQTGDYFISWDLVQEGVAWFSQVNVTPKKEPFTVVPGVVFYGSGFGHGVGLSQYGAQGLATGVAGPPLTGEQIIARYFPGTAFQFTDAARPVNRVLLSQPSSQTRYRCGDNSFFDDTNADVISDGGFRVLDETAGNAEIGRAAPGQKWLFLAKAGGILEARSFNGTTETLVRSIQTSGSKGFAVIPLTSAPLRLVQKDSIRGEPGLYRGELHVTSLGGRARVVNWVGYDDYTRGVVPLEMPSTWNAEAIKAQAYAARSYAYASYRGPSSDYDVGDDQADQCYGGVRVEKATSNAAVDATKGRVVTYDGAVVKTYFSSSSGGYTLAWGCWGNNVVRSGSSWVCSPAAERPYYAAVPDPADRAVQSPPNPRASWQVTFTGPEIVSAVKCAGGPDIGTLQGVDVSNQSPPGVGHVISVRVFGSAANADVRADDLLRSCLGLRSTMVRLAPF